MCVSAHDPRDRKGVLLPAKGPSVKLRLYQGVVLSDLTDLKIKYERDKGFLLRSGIFSLFLECLRRLRDNSRLFNVFSVCEFRDWIDIATFNARANGTFDESRSEPLRNGDDSSRG